jgi:tRNA pseudouridine13 synthase
VDQASEAVLSAAAEAMSKIVPTVPEAAEKTAEEPAAKDVPEEKVEFVLTPEDEALLDKYFGATVRIDIIKMYQEILAKPNQKAAVYGSVTSQPITDRELRTQLHKDMRRIFDSKLETSTDKDGLIRISAAPRSRPNNGNRNQQVYQQGPRGQQKGKLGWAELGGEYLHFSLYKENKDTMEVISYIAGRLGMKPRSFAFAGTKDRRGVTVQRVSVFRKHAEQIARLNQDMWGSRVGDFKYEKLGLQLGDLLGNEFHITLRDCQFGWPQELSDEAKLKHADSVVGGAVKSLQEHGFLNYYGLQRFGTYSVGTDAVGKLILKGDFKGAVDAILYYSPEALLAAKGSNYQNSDGKALGRDDIARAQAIETFQRTNSGKQALEKLPRKFSAESTLIRHLSRGGSHTDYMGAIQQINRNLRLMYVHAYQSLVWNHAVSERYARFGNKVVEGDLVLVDSSENKPLEEEVDENGEIVINPAADDAAASLEDMFQRARALTTEEAASGKYTIFDVVLPTPGFDIEYPKNVIGEFYKEFMASDGLDPLNMRRPQKDFSLSGSYRKIMGTVGRDVAYEVRAYKKDNEQFVDTDLEKIEKASGQARQERRGADDRKRGADEVAQDEPTAEEQRTKIAVIVKFQLGSSQYATMALRELMKEGGVVTYRPEFTTGR